MIVIPRGWGIVHELGSVVLVHPEGRDVAIIEYVERMRPLLKSGALVRRLLAEHPEFACSEVPDLVERLMTAEGEFAALATLPGHVRGAPAQRDVGFVFGDDFYSRLSAVCFRPERFGELTALVRDLVVADIHALGVRRRRFEYQPPRGWQPLVRNFVTDWLPPDYPDDSVHLTVYPANPLWIVPGNLLASLLGAARAGGEFARAPLHTPSGLAGEVGKLVIEGGGDRTVKLCAVLRDTHYAYALDVTARSDAHLEQHRDELDQVFASVQPLPTPPEQAADSDLAAHSYWIE